MTIDGNKYEADSEPRGASMYYVGQGWAFSSTGNFMDNNVDSDDYIETNTTALSDISSPDLGLYTSARVAPISLSYYGLCLFNGNYTVKLHFAEIKFSNDNTFSSLGKRIFDVYIQVNRLKVIESPNTLRTFATHLYLFMNRRSWF